MRLLLENGSPSDAARALVERISSALDGLGHGVDVVRCCERERPELARYDALFSHRVIPEHVRSQLACWGGFDEPRTWSLQLMAQLGLPVMRWARARSASEVMALFERWTVDRLLLKRSFTHGGEGVTLFERSRVAGLRWDVEVDVFCPEVNPADGDVYKCELFGGHVLISWMSAAPPLATLIRDGELSGPRGAYGARSLYDFSPELYAKLAGLGRPRGTMGLGHVSVDLMKTPRGELEVIELNLYNVAVWWTSRFEFFADRYARAMHAQLVSRPQLWAHEPADSSAKRYR